MIDVVGSLTHDLGKVPSPHWMIPTMTPNRPKALPKISTTKIFTKESGFWASAIAHPDPDTPTHILNIKGFYTHRRDCWSLRIFRSRRASTLRMRTVPNLHKESIDLRFFLEEWWPWWHRKWRQPHRKWRYIEMDIPDQILRSDSGSLDGCTQDTCTSDIDSPVLVSLLPCCSNDTGSECQSDTNVCPTAGRNVVEDLSPICIGAHWWF